MTSTPERKSNLHWYILLALLLGGLTGVLVNAFTGPEEPRWLSLLNKYVMEPVGQIFLRLLILTVVPLVFTSLALGVVRLGNLSELGRIGAKTIGYFLITMTTAVTIGLVLVNLIQPGRGIPPETRDEIVETFRGETDTKLKSSGTFDIDTIVNIVPRNPLDAAVNTQMLSVIFVALLVGVALTRLPIERAGPLIRVFEAVGDITVFIIQLAMRIAPFGVFALIFATASRFGFDLLQRLGIYVFVVLLGLLIQGLVVLPILIRSLGGMNPWTFYSKIRNVIVTAFSTSSSNATLPTSIRTAQEELEVPVPVAGFVLPLGATMNMNGTALFEGITGVFLAQVFLPGDLTLVQQIGIVMICVLTAIGAAGVPGGSIPLLAMVLVSVGVPVEAIALVLGIDRILDMSRTTLNVIGDLSASVVIANSEKGRLPKGRDITFVPEHPYTNGPTRSGHDNLEPNEAREKAGEDGQVEPK